MKYYYLNLAFRILIIASTFFVVLAFTTPILDFLTNRYVNNPQFFEGLGFFALLLILFSPILLSIGSGIKEEEIEKIEKYKKLDDKIM